MSRRGGDAVGRAGGGAAARRALGAGTALLALAFAPGAAIANMANPWTPGTPVGEPAGALKSIAVAEETLAIDLRGLAARGRARIVATYVLRNDGPAADLDLLFLAPGLVAGGVTLDGAPLASEAVAKPALPPEWKPPLVVPALSGGRAERALGLRADDLSGAGGLRFRAGMGPGPHALSVTYDAVPSEYHPADVYYFEHQITYVLAPARAWGSFDVLEIRVEVPAGWEAATTLPLMRTVDSLHGTFAGVPADAFAVTVRRPLNAPPRSLAYYAGLAAGLVAALLAGGVAETMARRRKGRGRRMAVAARLVGVVLIGGAALAACVLGADAVWRSLLDASQISRSWEYSNVIQGAVLGIGALAGGGAAGLGGIVAFRLVRGRPAEAK